jgi:hypothetical protein
MTHSHRIAAAFAVAAFASLIPAVTCPLRAQALATITGTITAAESGSPLAGAQVNVVGTVRRTVSDAQGRYRITIEPGSYSVHATTLGRQGASSDVTMVAGMTVTANFALASSAVVIGGLTTTTPSSSIDGTYGATLTAAHPLLIPLLNQVQQHQLVIQNQQRTIDDLTSRLAALEQKQKTQPSRSRRPR